MSTVEAKALQSYFDLRPVALPEPWSGFLLPVSGFPMPQEERPPMRHFIDAFVSACIARSHLSLELGLELLRLHAGGASDVVSQNGRAWMPTVGLGVWPNRPAPTFWTKADFENLGPHDKPRDLMHQVLRITKSNEVKREVAALLFGQGGVIYLLSPGDSTKLLENARRVLLPPIKDRSFTCFPFYLPLLDQESLQGVSCDQLDSWVCGASIYVRESKEDKGILIISREDLRAILKDIGGQPPDGPGGAWRFRF